MHLVDACIWIRSDAICKALKEQIIQYVRGGRDLEGEKIFIKASGESCPHGSQKP